MAIYDDPRIQQVLDDLREVRFRVHTIPMDIVARMSLSDQIKHGDCLRQVNSAIHHIEIAQFKAVNDAMDSYADELKDRAELLNTDLLNLQNATQIIRVAAAALEVIAKIAVILA